MKKKGLLATIGVISLLVVGGVFFWLGMKYQQQNFQNQMGKRFSNAPLDQVSEMSGGKQPGMGRDQAGPANIVGKVDKVDADTVTITTRLGSMKVTFSDDVVVKKPGSGNLADIKAGTEVFIKGERDDDGNIQTSEILITSP